MNTAAPKGERTAPQQRETRPVLFITYAWDDPDEAWVEDVSGSVKAARRWMKGRHGFMCRLERQPDGTYGNEQFVEKL